MSSNKLVVRPKDVIPNPKILTDETYAMLESLNEGLAKADWAKYKEHIIDHSQVNDQVIQVLRKSGWELTPNGPDWRISPRKFKLMKPRRGLANGVSLGLISVSILVLACTESYLILVLALPFGWALYRCMSESD